MLKEWPSSTYNGESILKETAAPSRSDSTSLSSSRSISSLSPQSGSLAYRTRCSNMCWVYLTYYACESCAWRDTKSLLKSQHMPKGLKRVNPQREVERSCKKCRNVKGHVDCILSTACEYVSYSECERCIERRGNEVARVRSRKQSERSSRSTQQMSWVGSLACQHARDLR